MQNLAQQNTSSVSAHSQYTEEEVIDLRDYWRTITSHKGSIFGLAFVFAIASALIVFSIKPVYRSTATLLIEPDSNNVVSIEEVYGVAGSEKEYYKTQYDILQSRVLADRVIDRLSLDQHPEFLPDEESIKTRVKSWITQTLKGVIPEPQALSSEEEREAFYNELLENFYDRLKISPVRDSQLVEISFEANDRQLAARVANTLADVYIENDLDSRLQMTSKATNWLTERLASLKEQLRDSEEKLQQYRESEKLVEVGGVTTLTAQQLTNLSDKLVMAKQNTAIAKASLDQVRAIDGNSIEKLLTVPAVLQDSLVSSLLTEQSKASRNVKSLAKRYGPQHNKMKQAVAELDDARDAVKKRVSEIVTGIEKEYQVARAKQSAIENSISSSKNEMQQINRKGYQLGVFEREVESNRQLYEMFLNRFKETSETAGLDKTNARISDPAIAAVKPVKPKKGLIIIIATFMGGFIGILLAFLLEHLDNTFKRGPDLENKLGLPVLGLLPHIDLKKGKLSKETDTPVQFMNNNPKSFFTE